MAGLFYVWDATQHNPSTTITTLEQAEYFATNPQDLGFTENLKNWLVDVENIVSNPELTENFDEEIGIQYSTKDVLEIAENKLWELEGYRLFASV